MTRVLTYIVSMRTGYAYAGECQNPSQFERVNSMPVQTCTLPPSLYFSGRPPQSLWFQLLSAAYVVLVFELFYLCKFSYHNKLDFNLKKLEI